MVLGGMKNTIKLVFIFLIVLFTINKSFGEELRGIENNIEETDPIKLYDEILKNNTSGMIPLPPSNVIPKNDELVSFLPNIDEILYSGWSKDGETKFWKGPDDNFFASIDLNELKDLGILKIVKQSYRNKEDLVDITIYEFQDIENTFSTYTIHRKGEPTKLKVGRSASESESGISFWKSRHFVDITFSQTNSKPARLFGILAGQEISRNIKDDASLPDLAIQLPSLYKKAGSEKYCKNINCFRRVFFPTSLDLDPSVFDLDVSEGIIQAHYIFDETEKDKKDSKKRTLKVYLIKHKENSASEAVYRSIKEFYVKKQEQNLATVSQEQDILKIQSNGQIILVKQRGNLIGLAFDLDNESDGKKILNLISWPVEISQLF